ENLSKNELIALIREQKSATSTLEKKSKNFQKKAEGLEKKAEGLEKKAEGVEKKAEGLEKKAEGLEKKAEGLEKKAEGLEKKAEGLEQEITWLKYQIAQLKRLAFGQKRERFEKAPDNLPQLPFETEPEVKQQIEQETTEKITYERTKKKHPGRQPLPDHLPVEEIEIYPEEDITGKVCIGKEVTDELEYQPARYYIKRYIRYKYAAKNGEGVVIGKLPYRVIDKCIAGPGLLASILVDKYMDHLPLYRQ